MRIVASGVTTVLQEHLAISTALRQFAGKEAFFLLRIYARNQTFLGLEVKGHGIALVLIVTHLENGGTFESVGCRIETTCGMYQTAVKTHINLVALQVHILILHLRVAIQMCQTRSCLVCKRVLSRILYW